MNSASNNLTLAPRSWRLRSDSDVNVPNNNDWNRRPPPVPQPVPPQPVEMSRGAQFEDRVRTGPFGFRGFPSQPHPPTRILVLENEMVQAVVPRHTQIIQESPPRIGGQWHRQLVQEEEESKLTLEEQKKALKKLTKQIYYPPPKPRRWRLYYRDNSSPNEDEKNEDGKGCAICLDDFVPYQEVLLTPCNHMFHDDCITPWVKSHGQCPVCRFTLGERRRENTLPLNNITNNANVAGNDLMAGDLVSLIRFMEEAFIQVNIPR